MREGTVNHFLIAACNETVDRWSTAHLLDRESELREMIDRTAGDVWLIVRTDAYRFRDPLEASFPSEYGLRPQFTSEDGHLAVYLIESAARTG
jgi:hypothetical protein